MYIDDSGTSPTNKVAVAAGWISPIQQWKKFEGDWKRAQRIQGDEFTCFHMSGCVYSERKTEFEDWPYAKKLRVIGRLRNIIKQRATKGFCLAVAKKDYDELVPPALKKLRGQHHYTWVIRNVMGQIHNWRRTNNVQDPIEYIFDWMERRDPRRKEIEEAFAAEEDTAEAFKLFGIKKGCCQFRDKCEVLPLQAADILAWTLYRGVLHKQGIKNVNEIARQSLADFVDHRQGAFVEGGDTNRSQVANWVARAMRERGITW